MAMNPDVQRKAQEELDKVVGQERLPSFADRSSLPYVEAVVKETLRWHPPAPIGIAHRAMEDSYYHGNIPLIIIFCLTPLNIHRLLYS